MSQLRELAILVVVACLACPALADDSGIQTGRYVFSADQSTIVQTGGIAGVHWTYRLKGQFVLSIDPNAGTASFSQIDANAIDDSPYRRTLEPNEVFAMTALAGTVVRDSTLSFIGKAANGLMVHLTATLKDGSAHLTAETTPPPGSADYFMYSMDATAQRKYAGGTGEPNTPYQIATSADLIALGNEPNDYGRSFVLTADIDLDPNLPGGKVFDQAVIAPLRSDEDGWFHGPLFRGVFDGGSHRVSHLTIIGGDYLGLFGGLQSATICDSCLVDVNITSSGSNVGAMAGVIYVAEVKRCCSTGVIRSTGSRVGGLIGWNYFVGNVSQCYSISEVSGQHFVGGLIGSSWAACIVSQCYSLGEATACDNAGGLAGCAEDVKECYSASSVHGGSPVGGLTGTGRGRECFWDTEASGQVTDGVGSASRTTAQMKMSLTFRIWADSATVVWTIDEGNDYPRLCWEHRPGKPLTRLCDTLKGSGTKDSPFLIYTPEELNLIGRFPRDWNKHFVLMSDIDMSGIDGKNGSPAFNIIAPNSVRADPNADPGRREYLFSNSTFFEGTPFTGTLDGNGHTIRHLTINDGNGGLFGGLGPGAEVRRLGVADVNISGPGPGLGALAAWNLGTVSQCYSSGIIRGFLAPGGLIGVNSYDITASGPRAGGAIMQCYSTCAVTGISNAGGLLGRGFLGTITQCYSTGSVQGDKLTGGLVGSALNAATASFWDTQTSGIATSCGGTGQTTAEMQTAKTFTDAGWDFVGETANGTADIWWIDEGKDYPRLWWETADER
jgi:hypothetical protein